MTRSEWQSIKPSYPDVTLEQRVAAHAREKPGDIAVIGGTDVLSWREIDRQANALAAALIARGLRPGDRLGWLGRNRPAFPVVLIAARRARLVLTGLNWRLSAGELARIVAVADCALIIADAEFLNLLSEDGKGETMESLFAKMSQERAQAIIPASQPNDPATLFFTSGTTGLPKGIVYSLETTERALGTPHTLGFAPDSRLLIVAPVFHMAGWVWTQYALHGGMTQILLSAAVPGNMLQAISTHRVTHAQLVPTMILSVLDELERTPRDISSLRMVAYGASPIQPHLLARARATLDCAFCQVYGLTETAAPISHLPPSAHLDGTGKAQATGIVNPNVELRIVDVEQHDVSAGKIGEIHARMPFPAAHYLGDGQSSGKGIGCDGWVRTGDAGYIDADGYLHVCDRIGEMIISGGENVYPVEVDNILGSLGGVREAAAFGMPDERWGEIVCCAVVMRDGVPFDEEALIVACRDRLAHYKSPRRVFQVQTLPRNATEKILRRELSRKFQTNLAVVDPPSL